MGGTLQGKKTGFTKVHDVTQSKVAGVEGVWGRITGNGARGGEE